VERLHGEVAIEDVVLLGAILEEEAVPDALVADAIAHEQVIGCVDGEPAVGGVPDGGADHSRPAHAVADQVEVDGVLAEDAFFAEVAELGVRDAARGAGVVHGVAADASRIR
jgi:hypothetical protein